MGKKSSDKIRDELFEYDNYRKFLQDYFEAKKRENHRFSQRQFCAKCGFSAHNYVTFVMQKKRNLSLVSIQKVIKGLGLSHKESLFFENLVLLNQAKTVEEKERYFDKLKQTGRTSKFYRLNRQQFFFYEKWYYPVVRELMALCDWKHDPAILAKKVRPTISVQEAREATTLLIQTGMVIKKEDTYVLAHDFVTSEHVPTYIKKKSRRDVLMKGVETIDSIAPEEKYVSYATLPMSKKVYDDVREKLDEVRQLILSSVEADQEPDEVYKVVLQMFPVSQIQKGGK